MRKTLVAVGLVATTGAAEAVTDKMAGVWQRSDGLARVRIAPCGEAICAINTWVKDPAGSEKVGDRLVMKVKPKSGSVLKGTAFDPQRQMTYAITVDVASRQSMTTRGCVLGGLLCKSVGWARLD